MLYSGTSLQWTPLVIRKGVHYKEVHTLQGLHYLIIQVEVDMVLVIVFQLLKDTLQFYLTLIITQIFPFYGFVGTKHRRFAERCPLFLSSIKRVFYETMTIIQFVLRNSVRYREVFSIKHVHYREVPLIFSQFLVNFFSKLIFPFNL